MFYSVFMADMMPKQVITLHHFDTNTEDRAQNFSRYFIPPIIWLTMFASIVQSAMDATAKFAMLTASASALHFLFWYHCNGCFICLWVHKIRDRVFEHQLQMADGHSLCVWMFGIGILHTWLQKPAFGGRFCHCIAFTGGIRNFGVLPI